MSNRITMYRGKPLDSYNKEELIEIIADLCSMVEREREELSRRADFLLSLRKQPTFMENIMNFLFPKNRVS